MLTPDPVFGEGHEARSSPRSRVKEECRSTLGYGLNRRTGQRVNLKTEVMRMKEKLPAGMVYMNVDIPVSKDFRDAALEDDPELEGLAWRLSQLLWEDMIEIREPSGYENEVPSLGGGRGSTRVH